MCMYVCIHGYVCICMYVVYVCGVQFLAISSFLYSFPECISYCVML